MLVAAPGGGGALAWLSSLTTHESTQLPQPLTDQAGTLCGPQTDYRNHGMLFKHFLVVYRAR